METRNAYSTYWTVTTIEDAYHALTSHACTIERCNRYPNPFTCRFYHDKVTTGVYVDDIVLYLTTACAPLHASRRPIQRITQNFLQG
jgi:hypothetical protein